MIARDRCVYLRGRRVAVRGPARIGNQVVISDRPGGAMAETPRFTTGRGRPLPLGVTGLPDGYNFALLCRHGARVTLVILPEEGGTKPIAEFPLHPKKNRTGDHWHVRVAGLPT